MDILEIKGFWIQFPHHHQAIHRHHQGVENSTQFWHYLPRNSVRGCHLKFSLTPSSDFKHQLQVPVVNCTSDQPAINQRLPQPSPGFDNLVEQITELWKPVYTLDFQFVIKGWNSGTARQMTSTGQGLGQGWFPCPVEAHHSPNQVFTKPALQTLCF